MINKEAKMELETKREELIFKVKRNKRLGVVISFVQGREEFSLVPTRKGTDPRLFRFTTARDSCKNKSMFGSHKSNFKSLSKNH
jgi:hypothetical protein